MTADGVLHRTYGSRRYGACVIGDAVVVPAVEVAGDLTGDRGAGGAAGAEARWMGEATEGMR